MRVLLLLMMSLMFAAPAVAVSSPSCETPLAPLKPIIPWPQIRMDFDKGFSVIPVEELTSNQIVLIHPQRAGYFRARIPFLFARDGIKITDIGEIADLEEVVNRWKPGVPMRARLNGDEFLITDRPMLDSLRGIRTHDLANPPARDEMEQPEVDDQEGEFDDPIITGPLISDREQFGKILRANMHLALPGVRPGTRVLAVGQAYSNETELLRVSFTVKGNTVEVEELSTIRPGDVRDFLDAIIRRHSLESKIVFPEIEQHHSWRWLPVYVPARDWLYISLAHGIGPDLTMRLLHKMLNSPRMAASDRHRAPVFLDGQEYWIRLGLYRDGRRVKDIYPKGLFK